jgi:malate dehydrogenase (oxaloacetate-decarboxylating)(NADP+)
MTLHKDALDYHRSGRPGKIEIRPTKPVQTQRDLSLAYTPGVAEPCRAIAEAPERVYDYTAKGNLVAVVTNGTAVLGLGNIGPAAGKPVMEGKAVLFKRLADIDVFDLEIAERDVDRFCEVVAALEPTFGGINLEDIAAPQCFAIEEKLRDRMGIPVFHDDQHGTAIIASAAFVNGLQIAGKAIEDVKCVFAGAGAAGMAIAKLFVQLGVKPEHLTLCDVHGVVYAGREVDMDPWKATLARETDLRSLGEAMVGADVFVGVSAGGIVSAEMVASMAPCPIVMAMANPTPEIDYPTACAARDDLIMATGRSDYPNQVNNVLGFPFLFRGVLDVRARTINEEMKLAAVRALAELAQEDVPDEVRRAYGGAPIKFGRDYIIPKPFDHRVLLRVAPAVARAAMETGVAQRPIEDWEAYETRLERILGRDREVMRKVIVKAARDPRRIVYPEGDNPRIIQAAQIVREEGIATPVLLGDPERIRALAAAEDVDIDGMEIIHHDHDERFQSYTRALHELRQRKGMTLHEASRFMLHRNYFGAMMVELGEVDGMVTGMTRSYPESVRPALQIIGLRDDVNVAAGCYMVILSDTVKFFADTTVNIDPDAETLARIAAQTAAMVRDLDIEPHVAMLSFSNFGSNRPPQATKVEKATRLLKARQPDLSVDGEMQVFPALDLERRKRLYPFCELGEHPANVLIFPNLDAGNIAYKLMGAIGGADLVGPILLGMRKPVTVLEQDTTARSVVNMTAITVVQALERAREAAQ